jgi:hypothetical protein
VTDAPLIPKFRGVIVDSAKLRDYCLSPSHPHGRHKARVFLSRFGLGAADAETLKEALLQAVHSDPQRLVHRKTDRHGRHYVLDFQMSTGGLSGIVRSIWIIPVGQQSLRLVTCYVM